MEHSDGSGIDSAACKYCGSRYWKELVGDAKIELLKGGQAEDGSSVGYFGERPSRVAVNTPDPEERRKGGRR